MTKGCISIERILSKLDEFLKDTPVTATILYSGEVDSLPEEARKFA